MPFNKVYIKMGVITVNKKFLLIFALILIISLSAVSASDDLNQANENSDVNANFTELQNKISNAEENSTI